jgi:O-antigen/teichoic acid export membrane protein
MSEEKQFFWNYFSLGLGQSGAYISQFIVTILVANSIQPVGYGLLSLFLMVSGIVCMLLVDWPNSSIVRYGKNEYIRTGRVSEVFWARLAILIVTSIIILFIFIFFRNFIDDYVGIKNATFLLIGYIWCSSIILFISNIFQTVGEIKLFGFMNFISKFFLLILVAIVLLSFHGLSVTDTVILYLLSQIIVVIVGIIIIDKQLLTPIIFSKKMIFTLIIFSWPMVFGALSVLSLNYVSTILINTYMTVTDVGIYSVAYMVMAIISYIILSLPSLLLPIIATMKAQQRTDTILEFMNDIIPQGIFLWSVIISLLTIICSFIIPFFYGPAFTQATTPLLILLFGVSFMSISAFHSSIMVNYDSLQKLVVISAFIATLNLIGSLILIPMIGLNGAALATAISYVIMNILYIPFVYPNLQKNFNGEYLRSNYKWIVKFNFPIFFVLPICLLSENLPIRIILSLIIVIVSIVIAKKMNVFKKSTLKYIDYVNMPNSIKIIIKRTYHNLL